MGACLSTSASGKYLIGPPRSSVVPPGQCQFAEEFTSVKLLKRTPVSHNVHVFTFETPDKSKPLGLATCAAILARGGSTDSAGNQIVRPYTPISTNDEVGQFELMVKIYPDGKMTQYLNNLRPGQSLEFKHIPVNVKLQYPFGKKYIGMLVGGTGITPMIQALHALLGTPGDNTQVRMLFGNRTSEDILAKDTLDSWAESYKDRFTVAHVLSAEPASSTWRGERGFISADLIKKYVPPPTEDVLLFVCGPPTMYHSLCGPRDQEQLTGILADLGYDESQVYKF